MESVVYINLMQILISLSVAHLLIHIESPWGSYMAEKKPFGKQNKGGCANGKGS